MKKCIRCGEEVKDERFNEEFGMCLDCCEEMHEALESIEEYESEE
ncbi:hypothetical protein QTL86_03405 [Cellulosilyticum sp. ST5]